MALSYARSSLLRSAPAPQLSFEELQALFALLEFGSFLRDDVRARLLGKAWFRKQLPRALEHPLSLLELSPEAGSLVRRIALDDKTDLDRAHHGRGAFPFAERHVAMRQFADLREQLAHGCRLARQRHSRTGGWIERGVLTHVADRPHHIDERREALLKSEVPRSRLGPSRNDERGRLVGLSRATPELKGDRLRDERHGGMQQPHHAVEHVRERAHSLDRLGAPERWLRELQIEIRELAPDEAFERDEVFAKQIAVDQAGRLGDRRVRARKDPPCCLTRRIGPPVGGVPLERLRMLVDRLQNEAADVP